MTRTRSLPIADSVLDLRFPPETASRLDAERQRLGDLFRMPTTDDGPEALIVADPDVAATVLASGHTAFGRGIAFERYAILLGNGLLLAEGDEWKSRRQKMQTCFRRDVLPHFLPALEASNRRVLDRWRAGAQGAGAQGAIDIAADALQMSLAFNLQAIYGDDAARVRETVDDEFFSRLVEEPPAGVVENLRFVKQFRELQALTRGLIERRRGASALPSDFLALLLAAYPAPEQTGAIVQETMTLLMAGYATVGSALQWFWWLLAEQPAVLDQIRDELAAIPQASTLTFADLDRLALTRRAIQESLRLRPPIWVITRRARSDCVLGGRAIAAGTHVLVLPWLLHRHAQHWQSPDEFDCERFNPDAMRARHKFAYIPFGAGPRNCIGGPLSTYELLFHVAAIAPHLRLHRSPGARPDAVAGPVMRNRTLRMQVQVR